MELDNDIYHNIYIYIYIIIIFACIIGYKQNIIFTYYIFNLLCEKNEQFMGGGVLPPP